MLSSNRRTLYSDEPAFNIEEDPLKHCVLCPHRCGVNRCVGEKGICGAGGEVVVSRVSLHFWEEPPISGETGSGTIFFAHCSLGCIYCQNYAISRSNRGTVMGIDELVQSCLDLQSQGALNINFVTPTHYSPLVRKVVYRAKREGLCIPVVWNTSGYETVEAIRENAEIVDVYLTDFKYANSTLGKMYSHVTDYPEVALAAIDAMLESVGAPSYDVFNGQPRMIKGVIVRHLMLPGHLDDSKNAIKMLHERYGSRVRLSIMNQYTPVLATSADKGKEEARRVLERYPNLAYKVSSEEYERLLDYADTIGIDDYFWQDGDPAQESFIPEF